jgi:hypothetical protein
MDYQIKGLSKPDPEFATYLHEQIKEFNNQHSLWHKQAKAEGAVKPVQIVVVDAEGRWQGGIQLCFSGTGWNLKISGSQNRCEVWE